MIRFGLPFVAAALSVCAFSACAGTMSPIAVGPENQVKSSALSRAPLTLDAATISNVQRWPGDTRLYVSNWNNTVSFPPASPEPVANSVSVFDLAHGAAPLPSVPVGSQHSQSYIAFDRDGKLYLANWAAQNVTVFDTQHGNAQLSSINGLANAGGIAIDRHGRLYVSNGAQIAVFDTLHGNTPLPPIALGQSSTVLALDRCGKLYVNAGFGQLMVLDTEHGNAPLPPIAVSSTTGSVISSPVIFGLTVDPSGKLYAATSENSILVFDTRRANKQLPAITGDSTFGPSGMVDDERGRLYVANFRMGSGNNILVFDTRNDNKLVGTITGDGMEGVNSVALKFVRNAVTPEL